MAKIVAYDLDGTLTREVTWTPNNPWKLYKVRTVHEGAAEQVRDALRKGYTIVIWTGRAEDKRAVTQAWLQEHNIPFHFLVMGKLAYTFLICDRARSLQEMDAVLATKRPDLPSAEFHRIARHKYLEMFPEFTVPTWWEMPPQYRQDRTRLFAKLMEIKGYESPPIKQLMDMITQSVHKNPHSYTVPWDNWPQIMSLALAEVWKRYGSTEGAASPNAT